MSRLSVFLRNEVKSRVTRSVVEYLDTVEVPNSVKKAIAMSIVKQLHIDTVGPWDEAIETAVSGVVDYFVEEVHHIAEAYGGGTPPRTNVDDYTKTLYASMEEAVDAAAKQGLTGVIVCKVEGGGEHHLPTGYRLWPAGVGPAPGEQVYP